ncbi:hypothetical protein E0Z10_g514 [Xylaria hypoxylon]|uniref:N-acetyltransferase domain-containing protein n=1 Tax=Xylaria hypoxylon TaxID=37992 RepID=A0A4Z0ZAW7_9PEZI|nr:hypothetical protein E0Z10_g514 [Xylaria hypoxylon]
MQDRMAAHTSDTSKFKITVIPADEDGCSFYLEQYKPFRLASLQQDAHAFGSTHAREIAFDDEAWLGRIRNPSASTFIAVQTDDNRVVASTSLIGPLPNANPASNPYQVVSGAIAKSGTTYNNNNHNGNNNNNNVGGGEPLYFQMSAVYTSPEARGQGLAKSLIKAATEEARDRARQQGRPLVLSVVVYAANSAAISVYERCGFARGAEGPKLAFNTFKNLSEEELNMYFQGEL